MSFLAPMKSLVNESRSKYFSNPLIKDPAMKIPPLQLYERATSDERTAKDLIYFSMRSMHFLSSLLARRKISSPDKFSPINS